VHPGVGPWPISIGKQERGSGRQGRIVRYPMSHAYGFDGNEVRPLDRGVVVDKDIAFRQ
jgi:hypothetical protein